MMERSSFYIDSVRLPRADKVVRFKRSIKLDIGLSKDLWIGRVIEYGIHAYNKDLFNIFSLVEEEIENMINDINKENISYSNDAYKEYVNALKYNIVPEDISS